MRIFSQESVGIETAVLGVDIRLSVKVGYGDLRRPFAELMAVRIRRGANDRIPARHRNPGNGTTRRTRVPRSFSLAIFNRPEIAIARSRMPIKPQCPGKTDSPVSVVATERPARE